MVKIKLNLIRACMKAHNENICGRLFINNLGLTTRYLLIIIFEHALLIATELGVYTYKEVVAIIYNISSFICKMRILLVDIRIMILLTTFRWLLRLLNAIIIRYPHMR